MTASIYTKTGDQGETGLVGGERRKKSDLTIQLYGEVDELNAHVGLALSLMQLAPEEIQKFIHELQAALFDLGANLACPPEHRKKFKLPTLSPKLVGQMEQFIDQYSAILPPLKNFVLPGGGIAGSQWHVCRTVCRRLERELVQSLAALPQHLPAGALIFINRLSDYFFMLARYTNHLEKKNEILWHG